MSNNVDGGRRCGRCRDVKDTAEFYSYPNADGTRRMSVMCRLCHGLDAKERASRDPKASRAVNRSRAKARRDANRERERATGRDQAKRRRARAKAEGKPYGYDLRDNRGGVYFVRSGVAGPIKIGWCKHSPARRLQAIQIGNPEEVFLVGFIPGATIYDETRIHDRFADLWVRGEWHRAESGLLQFIAAEAPLTHATGEAQRTSVPQDAPRA